jgi:uncharacterized membrane protein (UPF0127 family)
MKTFLLTCTLLLSTPAWAQDGSVPASAPAVDAAATPALLAFAGPEEVLVDAGEAQHSFSTQIANTPQLIVQNLRGVESLDPDSALLLVYMPPRRVTLSLESLAVGLDLLFIRDDGVVVKLIANAQPGSARVLPSDFPVAAVLEIASGRAAELNLHPGAIIRHDMFGTLQDDAPEAVEAAPEATEVMPENSETAPDAPVEAE